MRKIFTSVLLALLLVAAAAGRSLEEAKRQFEAGDYQQAIASLKQQAKQQPEQAELHFWLGRAYYEARQWDRAAEHLQRAVELAPGDSLFHMWLGRGYGQQAKRASWFSALSKARSVVREFERAVELDPANLEARRDLIKFYSQAPGIAGGGSDKALRAINELRQRDLVQAHLARADFFQEKENFDLVENEYRSVLALRPPQIEPYLEIADYYRKRKQPQQMAQAVEAAAEAAPGDPRLAYYQAVLSILEGERLAEAERLLRRYLDTVPDRSDFPSHASARDWLKQAQQQRGASGPS